MIEVRRAPERGHANHGWLDTHYTFSFSDYYDPRFMGFRALRVMNEDRVEPGSGFGMHGHRDMEIVTCVLEGRLQHKDSLGHGSVIEPGQFQRITAGTGIRHSEFNPSATEAVHLYQIWLLPEREGLKPGYEEKAFDPGAAQDRLQLVASRDGRDGSLTVHQDVDLYQARLAPGAAVTHTPRPGRSAWLQVARGAVTLNGVALQAGDGAAVRHEPTLNVQASEEAQVLLFDLA